MKRREFGKALVGGFIVAATGHVVNACPVQANDSPPSRKRAQMHVAEDHWDLFTPEHLQYLQRHGVKHLTVEHIKRSAEGEWDLDELRRMRDIADKNDLTISMLNFSRIRSSEHRKKSTNHIMAGTVGERDRQIDIIAGNIEKAAKIGVPVMRYHWRVVSDTYRNGQVKGKGGNTFLSWNLPDHWQKLKPTKAGRVTLDEFWERMSYYLERIMPVAEEQGVKIACHPPDPPLPPGYRGVDTWNYDTFNGFKKYNALTHSPNFGFLMCMGTIGEGLENPGNDELEKIIRYFGERNKIFAVHLRNIKGSRDHFSEWYPESGDMDFYKVMKTLHEVGYLGAVLPDHMPSLPNHPDDPDRKQAYAFGFGYIQAMIQAVNSGA
ncbi:MAG: mannonate dehydratase [Planctomycetes bacterium]|nr:mannonate dehydratase [Planctomycetota bacterium]